MRVATIGASHWHLPLYLEPLLEVPGAKVVGVSDPSQAVVAALCQRLDCAGDIDFRALGAGFPLARERADHALVISDAKHAWNRPLVL